MSLRGSSAAPKDTHAALLDSRPAFKAQLIQRAFVDQEKLMQKLRIRYGTDSEGKNNFKVQLRLNTFTLFVPEMFPEASYVTEWPMAFIANGDGSTR